MSVTPGEIDVWPHTLEPEKSLLYHYADLRAGVLVKGHLTDSENAASATVVDRFSRLPGEGQLTLSEQ